MFETHYSDIKDINFVFLYQIKVHRCFFNIIHFKYNLFQRLWYNRLKKFAFKICFINDLRTLKFNFILFNLQQKKNN